MNDDELKKLWQQQALRNPAASPAQLISAMQNKTTELRRTLLGRDTMELWACAFVIIIFGVFFFTVSRTPASRLGNLIVIGSSIFIAGKLVHARRRTPPAPPGATMVESLRADLKAVRAQSQLLRSVLWWYLLPLGIGILVGTWGNSTGGLESLVSNIAYTIFVVALFAGIYWLNQRARSQQLLPVEAQLEALLHSAETGEPVDETHRANLRPIILSMSAAGQVKPIEFKVAFRQVAIYGVSGVVGIWFFWMLSLSLDNGSWKANAQIPRTFAPSLHVEETNRYSVVARSVVDLLNTGDYTAVQKLYNGEMSKAFSSKKTSAFYARLVAQVGNIEKVEGPLGAPRGWVVVPLVCQRGGEWTMCLALDTDDRIAGIFFMPLHAPPATFKSFVLRFFSWEHLVWLPLFFLGGLLYSWLMQKLTKRAVGVSTLGVHLHKGLNLILWDEIKEVRPFKLLNIRSLWLIKESGEKTIMPWSSLERHSELKAAVESFAPADHPIRKYLALLRRR